MRKILYVYHSSIIGGGSYCLYNLIQKLDKEKYQPLVLLKTKGPLCDKLEQIGAKVYIENTITTVPYNKSIFNITSLKRLYFLFISFYRLKKLLIQLNPDIVYLNTMMMYPYLKVAKRLNLKTIIHIREHWPKGEHVVQYNLAKKYIERYADSIVAINNTSASMVNAHEKTTVVYDWIDFTERNDEFSFEQIFGEEYKSLKIFTFTGGIDRIKGTMEVISAFSSKILDKNARLLILGADTKLDYSGFRGTIAKYLFMFNYDTYPNRVRKMILNDERIVCVPSTYKIKQIIEKSYCILSFFTIPHANLILAESICLGQIVIAASTSEAIEYSNNGESAILFKMNDIDDFVTKIDDLSSNYDFYRLKAKNGMEYNKYLFDAIRNSDWLNSVYNNLF